MAVRAIECTECGTTVPYGRLSCPSCGELLASVAGSARRLTSLAEGQAVAEPVSVPQPAAMPSVLHDALPNATGEDAAQGTGWDADADPGADDEDAVDDAGDLGSLTWPTVPTDTVAAAGSVDTDVEAGSPTPAWMPPPFPPQPSITITPPAETPGAYVPPASVAAPGAATTTTAAAAPGAGILPAGLPAPARSWAGSGSADPGAAAADARDGAAARVGSELSLTDPARRGEAIDWIAVAGAALGSVGFLLPWARSIIGADGVGYLDTWGLAGPGHVLIVAGMLAVLALAVARTRVPAWLRLGLPGLVLSSLLVGLLWPYLLGPLGALPGAYLSLAGAIILGAAGVAALVTDRHARNDPRV